MVKEIRTVDIRSDIKTMSEMRGVLQDQENLTPFAVDRASPGGYAARFAKFGYG